MSNTRKTNGEKRTSDDIAHDLDRTRARLDATLGALERKLKPSRLAGEVGGAVKRIASRSAPKSANGAPAGGGAGRAASRALAAAVLENVAGRTDLARGLRGACVSAALEISRRQAWPEVVRRMKAIDMRLVRDALIEAAAKAVYAALATPAPTAALPRRPARPARATKAKKRATGRRRIAKSTR